MIMNIRSKVWGILVDLYPRYLRWRYGMDIGKNCRISWKAHLDKSVNPKGIHIGDNTWVLSGAMILAHDHCRSLKTDTYIGNQVVIGGGSVVTKSIHSNCIEAGNPAKILKENVNVQNGKILMN
jgi:acetyltransferase-like isoleucine patch superfamily enzyme